MSSNSDYLDGIPTTPNTVSDSWQPAVEQIDTTKKGFNAISLGNWDTGTTKPTVLSGGEIEAAGGVVRVATDETILDDPAGIASGTLYLVVDFSGTDPEWYFTNDVPVWNASLNGFYEAASGSVDWRYTGHRCEWDGAAAYSGKVFLQNRQTWDSQTRGSVSKTGSSDTDVIELLPFGIIYFEPRVTWQKSNTNVRAPTIYIEVYSDGDWREIGYGAGTATASTSAQSIFMETQTVLSDGENYRIRISSTTMNLTQCSLFYNKFATDGLYDILDGKI